jgi:hypothetical protein
VRVAGGGAIPLPCGAMFTLRPASDVEIDAISGTSVAEAREALAFWRRRLARLPWYRRSARTEAREMIARWQRRMILAELERWRLGALTRVLLAVMDGWPLARPSVWRLALVAARATWIGRMLAVIAAAACVSALAVVALAVVAIAHLL